jgi:hypothetical protein
MPESAVERHDRLLAELQKQSLLSAYLQPAVRRDMEAEAADPTLPDAAKLLRRDMLDQIRDLLATDGASAALAGEAPGVAAETLGLFGAADSVVIVPGLMGSTLSDVTPEGFGLIWLNPNVTFRDRLGLLQLGPYADPEKDLDTRVDVEPTGPLPILYDLLRLNLSVGLTRYSVATFPVDWRKDVEATARRLRDTLQGLTGSGNRPIHLVAHSQGALVARRGLQLLAAAAGEGAVRDRLKSLVLLGPANYGSFEAASGLAGNHQLIQMISPFVVPPATGFRAVLQSMSGLYQLLPYDSGRLPVLDEPGHQVGQSGFWPVIDADRLGRFYGWARGIDTTFFNDRTVVILGDNYTPGTASTATGVVYVGDDMRVTHLGRGDGTVPDCCAYLDGVRTYRVRNTVHVRLPTYLRVMSAVRDVLGGRAVATDADLAEVSREEALDPGGPVAQPQPFAATVAAVPLAFGPTAPPAIPAGARPPRVHRPPPFRRLRAFAFDPLLSRRLDTTGFNRVTLSVPWEENLRPGPVGEYLEVIDVDPATDRFYAPVDLNDPRLLAQDGLAPSEGDPQFHQQMVYAVAMTTIRAFEQALGRPALWAPHLVRDPKTGKVTDSHFVRRLRVHPHALREANAYYSPQKVALLFGYFRAPGSAAGLLPPGGTVFACLSHDIVAHETTHALLDGVHRYFSDPSNPDVLAFHEGFADVVALLQHFSLPEVLHEQIARTRGDIDRQENLLGALAVEFGRARGMDGALRDAIGKVEKTSAGPVWKRQEPSEQDYQKYTEPHDRGAVLVAAVFDAYLAIYRRRVTPVYRLATNGTGLLPAGELHPDLVDALATEAAKAARHLLQMCVRALDYCPPVDITFGEYLRALVTADADLVPDDDLNYRLAVVEAFARRGIYPPGVRNLAVESLLWRPPALSPDGFVLNGSLLDQLRRLTSASADPTADRQALFDRMRADAARVHELVLDPTLLPAGCDRALGVRLDPAAPRSIPRDDRGRPVVEVHAVRPAFRVGPDGQTVADLLVEITQRRFGYFDPAIQDAVDAGKASLPAKPNFVYRGGCTLVIDLKAGQVQYAVVKSVHTDDDTRLKLQRQYATRATEANALMLTYAGDTGEAAEPFAVLHRC